MLSLLINIDTYLLTINLLPLLLINNQFEIQGNIQSAFAFHSFLIASILYKYFHKYYVTARIHRQGIQARDVKRVIVYVSPRPTGGLDSRRESRAAVKAAARAAPPCRRFISRKCDRSL